MLPPRLAPTLGALALAVCAVLTLSACSGPTDPGASASSIGQEQLVRVPADAPTVQDAAARVAPGGMILIAPGTYPETVTISTPDVTVRGEDRNGTVIDGGGIRPYGVVSIADGVRVENLTVTGATFYGVLFTGLHDDSGPSAPSANGYEKWDPTKFPPLQRYLVDHVTATNNGLYGIYAFNAQHGVIRDSYASGSADSGIYLGQCVNCDALITGNVAERNAVGFENANASDSVLVAGNRFAGNRIGMTLLSSYQEAFTPQRGNDIVGNLLADNVAADSPSQADGAFATGVGISGGQNNRFARNLIAGNPRAGAIISNTEDIPSIGNRFDGDVFSGNGVDVANISAARSPAVGTCAPTAATALPDALLSALTSCSDGTSAQPAAASAPGPDVPPGMSFLKVPAPKPQPNLAQRSSYPRLPDRIDLPDAASFPVPGRDLLGDLSGTR
ncbi:right-handed parallel beta-helix repeat-containing protein [Microbacterium dextranolyticum]|uniref:Right handed beta helix domain-containing protein n=1 Tax=Microbacterium dextranolyticum TaxID=36806 RepID=A0A9W6HJS3_9MICO|nr:right-handed parallel beta-helix repeat-containing protein [Microbacterium dextranolyticum]MBM7462024.1 hypothetical protein [Microbacterium dextranolyticum]GLJ94268.1 hypothetical protein GCM10017591_03290 [Microbacterium dextranolyticum]